MAIVIESNNIKFIKGHLNMIKFSENTFFKIQGQLSANASDETLNIQFKNKFEESPPTKLNKVANTIPEEGNLSTFNLDEIF